MYEQTLYKVVEPIKPHVIKRLNKFKKWEYEYSWICEKCPKGFFKDGLNLEHCKLCPSPYENDQKQSHHSGFAWTEKVGLS